MYRRRVGVARTIEGASEEDDKVPTKQLQSLVFPLFQYCALRIGCHLYNLHEPSEESLLEDRIVWAKSEDHQQIQPFLTGGNLVFPYCLS